MKAKWKKVLYEKQSFPDNHVDPSFLSELRKNVNLYHFGYTEALIGVCSVTHEVSCTVLFFLIFVYLKNDALPLHVIAVAPGILTWLSAAVHFSTMVKQEYVTNKFKTFLASCKSCAVFVFFGYFFSPVFQVLTDTISSDTIYAMVAITLFLHILFQNYGSEGAIVSPSLSLNSAIFSAVCLSSRLQTELHTFILLMSAVQLFVLMPLLRQKMLHNQSALMSMTVAFAALTLWILYSVSPICAVLMLFVCFFIDFVCPYAFVYCQKYKETIFGPWDEAIVKHVTH